MCTIAVGRSAGSCETQPLAMFGAAVSAPALLGIARGQVGVDVPADLGIVLELPALGRIVVSRPSSQRTR